MNLNLQRLFSLAYTPEQQAQEDRGGSSLEWTQKLRDELPDLYARHGIKLSSRELDELTRRKVLLLLYLLRDPLFGRRTQPVLQAVLRTTSRVPLVGWALSLPVSLLEGIQRYYTYTSGA